MGTYQLEAAADHVQRLAHEGDAVRAVIELVWNALDADADNVSVILRRNEADGIDGVIVEDDGHGMSPEAALSAFRWIGGSWKRRTGSSQEKNRPLHGKSGQGRLRAFALGSEIRWTSTARDTAGKAVQTTIRSNSTNPNDFDIAEPIDVAENRGTVFEASGKSELDRLETDETRTRLVAALAPYLMRHSTVKVTYDRETLNPSDNVDHDQNYDLLWTFEDELQTANLRIIEWKKSPLRSIHLCDADGMTIDEIDPTPAADFRYSAYVMWEGMQEHQGAWPLARFDDASPLSGLLKVLSAKLNEHFEERRANRRRQLVAEWITDKTYPYSGEPSTDEEKVERATFDVVATSIRRHVPKGKKQQKLTLGLLKQSLQQRPTDVSALLDQFLGLPAEEREQLDRLLKRTSLSRVIQATTSVSNRLEFIRALELMVFDPEANKMVGEREHLHKILENELWIFGEEHNLMVSERGLTYALDRHLEILGKDRSNKSVVRRLDGKSGRLDLLLSAAATEHDRNRHLVVELKAPRIVASHTELTQIKSYAKAVAADARFADTNTIWDFWLITSTVDEDVEQERNQRGRPRGIVFEPELPSAPGAKVRVWVKTWGEIIQEATNRLSYFQKSLQHDASLADATDYLRRNHGNVIPESLLIDHSTKAAT